MIYSTKESFKTIFNARRLKYFNRRRILLLATILNISLASFDKRLHLQRQNNLPLYIEIIPTFYGTPCTDAHSK